MANFKNLKNIFKIYLYSYIYLFMYLNVVKHVLDVFC